jgi:hypothetical protein
MFQVGSYANRGLSQLVLTGDTHTLEQELANEVSIYLLNKKKENLLFKLNSNSNVIETRLVYVF